MQAPEEKVVLLNRKIAYARHRHRTSVSTADSCIISHGELEECHEYLHKKNSGGD